MLTLDLAFFVPLVAFWFLLYWILAGVLFSILALMNVHRIRRTRFGCLFTFTAIGSAAIAAWGGTTVAHITLQSCALPTPVLSAIAIRDWIQTIIRFFACGIVPLTIAFVLGLAMLILLGFILLHLSRRTELSWIEPQAKKREGE